MGKFITAMTPDDVILSDLPEFIIQRWELRTLYTSACASWLPNVECFLGDYDEAVRYVEGKKHHGGEVYYTIARTAKLNTFLYSTKG